MNRRLAQALMFFLLVLGIACTPSSPTPKVAGDSTQRSTQPIDIGHLLFEPTPWPTYESDGSLGADPIRVPLCLLTVLAKVEVPSKEEGTIAWLGVELKPGEPVDPTDVHEHVQYRWTMKETMVETMKDGKVVKRPELVPTREAVVTKYRRLRVGERVMKGQVIALLDDVRATLEHDIAFSNIEGAKKELESAANAVVYQDIQVQIELAAKSSLLAIASAKANLAKAESERSTKDWGVERARGEERKAQDKLNNHQVRAPITGDVANFSKQVGEGVKPTESIMLLQNSDRLGIEGFLQVQYVHKVRGDTEVFIEPSITEPPVPARSPHASSKPITAIVIGAYENKPVIVSASEDGSVYVWDPEPKSTEQRVHAYWKYKGTSSRSSLHAAGRRQFPAANGLRRWQGPHLLVARPGQGAGGDLGRPPRRRRAGSGLFAGWDQVRDGRRSR